MRDRYTLAALSSILSRFDEYDRGDRTRPGGSVDERLLRRLITMMEKMMPTIDEVLAKAYETGDRLDSLIAYQAGLKAKLEEALANVGGITPEQQAAIDATFVELSENVAKTDAALNNSPAGPLPPAEPVPPA